MFRRVVLSLAILLLTASSAAAQRRPDTHSGFWLGGGLGGGWFEGTGGGAAYIRLGGTPHPKALFGGEALTWFRDDGVAQTNVTATALFYPGYSQTGVPGHDLFLKAGFGAAANDAGDAGVGLTFGTGYDFRLGDNLYVTPNLDLMIQFLNDATFTAVLFTLGMGFH